MALKIRLRQQGATNHAFFRLVVTESTSPRDGKYIESLGWYNPQAPREELELSVQADRVLYWINNGAQMSECAFSIMKKAAPQLIHQYSERLQQRARKRAQKRKKKA